MKNWESPYSDTTYDQRPYKSKPYNTVYDQQPSVHKSSHNSPPFDPNKDAPTFSGKANRHRNHTHHGDHRRHCTCHNWECSHVKVKKGLKVNQILCYVCVLIFGGALLSGIIYAYYNLFLYCYECVGEPGSTCATMSDPQKVDYKACLGKVCVSMCNKQTKIINRTCMKLSTFLHNNSQESSSFCATDKCNTFVNHC